MHNQREKPFSYIIKVTIGLSFDSILALSIVWNIFYSYKSRKIELNATYHTKFFKKNALCSVYMTVQTTGVLQNIVNQIKKFCIKPIF